MSRTRTSIVLPRPFGMRRGGNLPQVEIAYETWGELNTAGDNTIVIFTGLSPNAHATSSEEDSTPGWWEEMVGPGRPLDTERFHVICFNSLGSCFGSTGPASIDPRTDKPYETDFPDLSIEDIAASGRAALQALGIAHVRAVVGPSLGGMTAMAFAVMFPDAVDELVVISSAMWSRPFAIAIRSMQRELIRSDPDWHGGHYLPGHGPREGMRMARKLGMLSYRSAAEWQQRFGRERVEDPAGEFGIEFEVEAYLESRARRFIGLFDANAYLYLSRAMDWFDISEHGRSVADALSRLKLKRALVVGVETDFLFPIDQQREMADAIRDAGIDVDFHALPSLQGHDAFLVDMDRFRPVVADFLAGPKS